MTDQMELLARMSRDFAASGDIEQVFATGLEMISATLDAEGGALFLLDGGGNKISCHASFGPVDITGLVLDAGEGIVGRVIDNDTPEIVRDVALDPAFSQKADSQSGFTTRSILCAPLSLKGEKIGAIEVVNKVGGDGLFSVDDLGLLETLSASASLAIANARMAGELVEKEKMRRELELAAEIQKGLLPGEGAPGGAVHGINLPARVVSGDFYDFFKLDDGRTCFTLADVSGKGMNAALLMAKTASLFRALGKETPEPGRLLARINDEVVETATRGMFVTMLVGVYDPATGIVTIANAGHEPPVLHRRDGSVESFAAGMPPVGIMPDIAMGAPAPQTVIKMDGGAFYVFTDGVTEGYLADGSELGADGFNRLVAENAGLDPLARIKKVAETIRKGAENLRDDLTVLVVDDAPASASRPAVNGDGAGGDDRAPAKIGEITVPAVPASLAMVRKVTEAATLACGFSREATMDVVLAVDEACQNVIRHAYGENNHGEMRIGIEKSSLELEITIRDFAPAVDITKIKPRDIDDMRPGGLGTHFINEVMNRVEFRVPDDGPGNILLLGRALERHVGK